MRIIRLLSIGIALISLPKVWSTDPWDKANEMLRQAVKRVDPIGQHQGDETHEETALYIPMDYDKKNEERHYSSYWDDVASDWHKTVYQLLVESSEQYDNPEATFTLAQIHLWGYYGLPYNKSLAFDYADRFNNLTRWSNSSVLFDLAVMHSTGLFGEIPVDPVKALLCYQRAASLGDLRAKNALAYKYYTGSNVPRDCNKAQLLYKEIADEIREFYTEHEWNVYFPYVESFNVRLPDFSEGLLGKGLTSMTTSAKRMAATRPDITSSFLTRMSEGNIILNFGSNSYGGTFASDDDDSDDKLVDLYYMAWDKYKGTYTSNRDCEAAMKMLKVIFAVYDSQVPYMDNLQKFFYGRCLDLLGHIYFTGEAQGLPNIPLAEKYLKRSIEVIEKSSNVRCRSNIDLGLIHQYVYGNETEAVKYYERIGPSGSNDGTVDFQLAKLSSKYPGMNLGDPFVLMQRAYLHGHTPSIYEFAKMTEQGVNNRYSCEDTTYLFKRFVELNEAIMAPQLRTGYGELMKGNAEVALWAYAQAAEQGYEAAQVSAAYILYQLPYNFEDPPRTTTERKTMAISYYIRAFKQDNADAGVVAGDIFYHMGNYSKAMSMYQSASLKFSPQAIWNLGYMYEYGLGTEVDYHLAKRYYDQVLEHNPRHYLAVKLSVLKLRIKSWLTWLTGGRLKYGTIEEDESARTSQSWLSKLVSSFKKAGRENAGLAHEPDSQGLPRTDRPAAAQGQQHEQQREQEQDSEFNSIWDTLDSLGLQVEDLVTIGCVLFIFLFSLVIRTFAARRGWNVRNNGVRIQLNGQRPRGNFDIQIFAI